MEGSSTVDIVICSDLGHWKGVVALMHSLVRHSPVDRLFIHILTDEASSALMTQRVNRALSAFPALKWDITRVDRATATLLKRQMRVSCGDTAYLANVMNFARLYLGKLFLELDRILYIDADMVVKADVCELWDAVQFATTTTTTFGDDDGDDESHQPFAAVDRPDSGFQAGLFVTSLQYWRNHAVVQQALDLMKAHKASSNGLWKFGTQPILQRIFTRIIPLPKEWNTDGLGYNRDIPETTLSAAKVLHWSGARKPWLANGLYQSLWTPYFICE